jgi:hypothetical protein
MNNILLNEISQNKKLKRFVDFSIILEWYLKNKNTIAQILGVSPDELATEEEILAQSQSLIDDVINRQSHGNYGNITRFESFKRLQEKIPHDILHNLYNVTVKEFDKILSDYEFTIEEIIEEIEVLAIEESFMKYFGVKNLNMDFINQNLNQLASYLVVTFIKEYLPNFLEILSGKDKPYLIINNQKVYLENTSFENIGKIFNGFTSFDDYNIDTEESLKSYLLHLLYVDNVINDFNGDRGQYPDAVWYNIDKETIISNIDDDDKIKEIENIFYYKDNYKFYTPTQIYLYNLYQFIDDNQSNDILYEKLYNWFSQIDIDNYFSHIDKIYNKQINHNITDKQNCLYFLNLIFKKNDIKFLRKNTKIYNTLLEAIDEVIDDSGDLLEDELNGRYIVYSDNNKLTEYYSIDSFIDEYSENLYEYEYDVLDNNHGYIIKKYGDYTTEQLLNIVLEKNDAQALFRRNFRFTDLIRNVSNSPDKKEIPYNIEYRLKYAYNNDEISQKEYDYYLNIFKKNQMKSNLDIRNTGDLINISLSKKPLTENGKKLLNILNNFKGYVILNNKNIKNQYKKFELFIKNHVPNISDDLMTNLDIDKSDYISKLKYIFDTLNIIENTFNENVLKLKKLFTKEDDFRRTFKDNVKDNIIIYEKFLNLYSGIIHKVLTNNDILIKLKKYNIIISDSAKNYVLSNKIIKDFNLYKILYKTKLSSIKKAENIFILLYEYEKQIIQLYRNYSNSINYKYDINVRNKMENDKLNELINFYEKRFINPLQKKFNCKILYEKSEYNTIELFSSFKIIFN